jgi:hypothetical protein
MMGKNPVYSKPGRVSLFLTMPRFIVIHTSGYNKKHPRDDATLV